MRYADAGIDRRCSRVFAETLRYFAVSLAVSRRQEVKHRLGDLSKAYNFLINMKENDNNFCSKNKSSAATKNFQDISEAYFASRLEMPGYLDRRYSVDLAKLMTVPPFNHCVAGQRLFLGKNNIVFKNLIVN
ncbi:hypothetical protein PUN28_020355 [Cardiocondyla obscurior]|uniref:Uncharacterized protein n=1 Tax=Cardiocondyla obscurior TaxID=286306 RepID=A0AAW2E818_9HYME